MEKKTEDEEEKPHNMVDNQAKENIYKKKKERKYRIG
jgi:hypothetical protein